MAYEMNISAESVRMIAQKARAVSTSMPDSYEDGHEGDLAFDPVKLEDAHLHEGLAEEKNDDLMEEELREIIDDLNVDEASELVAITWLGRGDFDSNDFELAVNEAKARSSGPTSSYLLGLPHLPDHLENGLDALNL